ncbi:hypothetical protein [Clostridium botulinum]|uniref:hypothetical protein n=1 Tax=Clostridium botulinum TaxID=1491 RepID=UPI000773927C|nr:hypothetical protein [Clostridium botulinum]MBY6811898.1 hypothetical protein [Clostridium botulinum]MBY6825380.1 hypothetical protein [Clostridium botulinum]MBY6835727.1 hypothetical protein [Clostridium botulinum]MBY6974414.1 hypothetical protein [Clostridium botulinum]MCS6105472.1 hypothetical protein [Clostridium botulinum]
MSEIKIDGEVYKEMKIKNLIVDGKLQNGFSLLADQLEGKSEIHVTIEAEPTIKVPEIEEESEEKLK